MIKHVWLDFSETIGHINRARHDKLKYGEYAKAVNRPISNQLKEEFDREYKTHGYSIANIFHSLGYPAGYWSDRIATVSSNELYSLAEESIPKILQELLKILPISIFSNINLDSVLPELGLNLDWFTHIVSSGDIGKPKPAVDGYNEIVELSQLPAGEILYVGDNVEKDIIPAKSVGLKAGLIWSNSDKADYVFNSFKEILDLIQGFKS